MIVLQKYARSASLAAEHNALELLYTISPRERCMNKRHTMLHLATDTAEDIRCTANCCKQGYVDRYIRSQCSWGCRIA